MNSVQFPKSIVHERQHRIQIQKKLVNVHACTHTHISAHPPKHKRTHTQQYFLLICAMQLFHISNITLFCLLASKGSLKTTNYLASCCVSLFKPLLLFSCFLVFFPLYETRYSSCSFVQYLLPKTSETEWRRSHRTVQKRVELSHKQLCSASHNFWGKINC